MSSPTRHAIPSDASLRQAVLDTTHSWMLQAPAGSGKTELLMQRFLACVARVEQPESVLAITFTRKAAAEMRNRILSALQRAEAISDDELERCREHERKSLELARKVLQTSATLGWKILQNPSRLQVRTLDSFCEAVAQRAPFKGLLGGSAQVTEDSQPLYEIAAQRVIEELASPGQRGDAVATLLAHLDNDVQAARSLLAALLAQRDQWLKFLGRSDVFDFSQQQMLRRKLERALVISVEEELALIRSHLQRVFNDVRWLECSELMRYSDHQRAEASGITPVVVESIAASAEVIAMTSNSSQWMPADAQALAEWRRFCAFLLTSGKPALRKSVDKRHGFPNGTEEQKQWKRICLDFFSELAGHPNANVLCEALHRVRRLPNPQYTESQWRFMQAILELLPLAAAHLKVVFAEQSTIDFAEYAQRALEAIGEQSDPSELGLQLGYRIRHVLVDEFQDTNHTQIELLARLIRTWEEDDQCTTFYVGDPMQSIYSFRQADVAIYQQARKEPIGGHQHSFGQLTQNFRSQGKLVDWFNRVFPFVLSDESDLTNAVRYAPAQPSRAELDGPAVHIKGFAKADRSGEAAHIAKCIRRELELPTPPGEKPTTIAVLVRSRTHLPHITSALHDAGIRYRGVKTDRLSDRPLVRDFEALRSALMNLSDRTAWLSVLRAPWCGLELSDLLALCKGDERSTVRELLDERIESLSAHARGALHRCLPVLDAALAKCGRESLRMLIESTWLRLGGAACLADREQGIRDAEAYFALLDEQSVAGTIRDPGAFIRRLHDLFAPADNRGNIRVEIMPIHQAKGLEWDVVFLPALERRSRQDDKSLLYWRSRRSGEEEYLLLGPMEAAGKRDTESATIESYLRNIASDCSREELKRLLYVGATRARQRLYLSAAIPDSGRADSNSMLGLLWDIPAIQSSFVGSIESGTTKTEVVEENTPGPQLLLRRLPASYSLPPAPAALNWRKPDASPSDDEHRFEWVGDLLPRVGVVAHSFLQRIATDGVSSWSAERIATAEPAISASLRRAGVMQRDLGEALSMVSQALTRTLADECGRWLLSPHDDHCCEFALSGVVDGRLEHVRVDRTFVEGGVRWLIDYKISRQLGGDRERFLKMQVDKYRSDMERYLRVIRLFDSRPVRCALYFPLLSEMCRVELDVV